VFQGAVLFARSEGLVVAPRPATPWPRWYGNREGQEEAREKVIVFGLSGHGMLDLQGYADYFAGLLEDYEYPEDEVKRRWRCFRSLPA
jgi:tryptophan synthase beta chain